jgi:hypothetical protein
MRAINRSRSKQSSGKSAIDETRRIFGDEPADYLCASKSSQIGIGRLVGLNPASNTALNQAVTFECGPRQGNEIRTLKQ